MAEQHRKNATGHPLQLPLKMRGRVMRVLGIETSCDETAASVVTVARQGLGARCAMAFEVHSSVVASQVDIHARYGGIVPEVAAREHVGAIMSVIEQALHNAHLSPLSPPSPRGRGEGGCKGVDAIAVTSGPGLMTSLAVGVETARTLAYAWGKPVVGVNHIEGHVLSALLPSSFRHFDQASSRVRGEISSGDAGASAGRDLSASLEMTDEVRFPTLALIVSGGHTELLLIRGWGKYELIGATRDDAVGEAFDKVAKMLDLGYPGGPIVSQRAEEGDPTAFAFPRPMMDSDDFEFSFSGLKTAVRYMLEREQRGGARMVADVCASFQRAAVEVLVAKTVRAARHVGAKTVLLGGGVAANAALREQLGDALGPTIDYRLPALAYTGDNAAMIAAAGGVRLLMGRETGWQRLAADANWELGRE
ncbi:MAG: tRNA (adenosine(37)-N6)-threonylcarbamoyltransferase complex transferase subunit TsaD [bacterium]|nr:tRNA (adenosine(37)-N6)-threonylcarbamoyltransferase complex transferase subunit TsaD [bacterium]